MADSIQNKNNEILTFYELVSSQKVEIPIIQRDYAQGRPQNELILRNFLLAIRENVNAGTPINLDFIYGDTKDNVFKPIDGQQRLTTLFLLHWYALAQQGTADSSAQEVLRNFTYETRISSRRFCLGLVSNCESAYLEGEKPSENIQDSRWFFRSWKNDPTIRAMLHSIDIIHELFQGTPNLWEKLTEKRIVTFHRLPLENFGLSDDLYIKMNARGKALTPYENLKAEIQEKIDRESWETGVKLTDQFAYKIDTLWTDFLWSHFRKGDSVDSAHMNFMTTLVMFCLAVGKQEPQKMPREKRIETLQRLNADNSARELVSYIDQETFTYICQCYDLYAELVSKNALPEISFEMWRHTPDGNLLNQILTGRNTSYTHRVLFFAQTEYLLHNEDFDQEKFLDWMRVVRNIVSRGDVTKEGKRPDIIRSPEAFYGAINLIHEISAGCKDIYGYLLSANIRSLFGKEQMSEEVLKSKIIAAAPERKPLLFALEDNEILRGKILRPLTWAGYEKDVAQIDFSCVEKIQRVFHTYFNKDIEGVSNELDPLRRAMLTIEVDGRYRFYDYWSSYWYAGEAEKRKLFPMFRELEFFLENKYYSGYFRKLVFQLFDQTYDQIIEKFQKPDAMDNWQYELIKKPELLGGCHSKYIAISNDSSCCYLLKNRRPASMEGSPKIS